jgi:hypothetical protein
MIMVGHQTIPLHDQPEPLARLPERFQESAAVLIIAEDQPPLVSAGRDVVRCPLELDAQRTGHAAKPRVKKEKCQVYGVDPGRLPPGGCQQNQEPNMIPDYNHIEGRAPTLWSVSRLVIATAYIVFHFALSCAATLALFEYGYVYKPSDTLDRFVVFAAKIPLCPVILIGQENLNFVPLSGLSMIFVCLGANAIAWGAAVYIILWIWRIRQGRRRL